VPRTSYTLHTLVKGLKALEALTEVAHRLLKLGYRVPGGHMP
jgi:hypothetical protein